jgi:Cu/Ag efflux protein CusF
MFRAMVGSVAVAFLVVCLAAADEKKGKDADKNKQGNKATITKVDPKAGTVTVRMKDATGKEVERTFKLTEDIQYLDSTGKVARIDVFQSGDEVLIIEAEGRLKQMKKANAGTGTKDKAPAKDKKPGEK